MSAASLPSPSSALSPRSPSSSRSASSFRLRWAVLCGTTLAVVALLVPSLMPGVSGGAQLRGGGFGVAYARATAAVTAAASTSSSTSDTPPASRETAAGGGGGGGASGEGARSVHVSIGDGVGAGSAAGSEAQVVFTQGYRTWLANASVSQHPHAMQTPETKKLPLQSFDMKGFTLAAARSWTRYDAGGGEEAWRVFETSSRLDHLVGVENYIREADLRRRAAPYTDAQRARYFDGASPFAPPPGWKAGGCGVGPPPDKVRLEDLGESCMLHVAAYDKHCLAGRSNHSAAEKAEGMPALHYPLCVGEGAEAGRPVHVLVGPAAFMDHEKTCGPAGQQYDVLDVAVHGPRSVEYAFEHVPDLSRPWLKIVSFRPMEAGSYDVHVRSHLSKMKQPMGFVKRKKKGRMPVMPTEFCPVAKCQIAILTNKIKVSPLCMARSVPVVVAPGKCVMTAEKDLPPCHASFPTVQEDWYGRWVQQCNTKESCARHPVPSRPLDRAREKGEVTNNFLASSVSSCNPTVPTFASNKMFQFDHWRERAGWVWKPHACRARVFDKKQAWSCLDKKGLLGVGDSLASTNGHLFYVHMGMKVRQKDEFKFSQTGNRTDEIFGDVTHAGTGGGNESFFFSTMTRQYYYDLQKLAQDIKTNAQKAPRDWAKLTTLVTSIGLHDSYRASKPISWRHMELSFNLTYDIGKLSLPMIFHPSPGTVTYRACTRKNAHRAHQINMAYQHALRIVTSRAGRPPVAFTPLEMMGRSLSWQSPTFDGAGTHPFCSFVGLTTWMQTLDIICPLTPTDTFTHDLDGKR